MRALLCYSYFVMPYSSRIHYHKSSRGKDDASVMIDNDESDSRVYVESEINERDQTRSTAEHGYIIANTA